MSDPPSFNRGDAAKRPSFDTIALGSMRGLLKLLLPTAASALIFACADKLPEPINLTIEPSDGPSMIETEVTIRGEGLSALVMLDHQSGAAAVDFRVRAMIGRTELINAYLAAKNE